MTRMPPGTRARARAETTRAILDEARRQLAEQGAAALSLRSVAREVGMVSSAVYRYVANRDELLTLLVVDAYTELGDEVDAAVEAAGGRTADRFTALAGAATSANLVEPLESLSDVTIFCPNNDAFQKLAGTGANITDEQLAEILQYHVVQGAVGYSTTLSNDLKLPTLAGEELTITIDEEGGVFVNNARVINSDILIANGVLHVIDTVLNPAEADAEPSTGEEPSATLASIVPFTSGIEAETSVYSELTHLMFFFYTFLAFFQAFKLGI